MKNLILSVLLLFPSVVFSATITLDYGHYKLYFDCERHGTAYFYYETVKDTGNYDTRPDFIFDQNLPSECRQKTTDTYSYSGQTYDRGHLVPANHWDSDQDAYDSTFYMSNILPQTSTLNRGAWKKTENIVECYRDIVELRVWGGPIWGDDQSNDFFVSSHGVITPDFFWKIIFTGSSVIAWQIPNNYDATSAYLDDWLVTVREIEEHTGHIIDIPDQFKDTKPDQTWRTPEGCDLK